MSGCGISPEAIQRVLPIAVNGGIVSLTAERFTLFTDQGQFVAVLNPDNWLLVTDPYRHMITWFVEWENQLNGIDILVRSPVQVEVAGRYLYQIAALSLAHDIAFDMEPSPWTAEIRLAMAKSDLRKRYDRLIEAVIENESMAD